MNKRLSHYISTFFIAYIHGPLRVSAELVDGIKHALRVPSGGVFLYCTKETLKYRDRVFCNELFSSMSRMVRMKCPDSKINV